MQEILQSISEEKQQNRLVTSLQYLKNDRGDPQLLQAIQEFVNKHTEKDELPATALSSPSSSIDSMFVTHGVSHGLDLLCTTQTRPGDVVLVERPTYFLGAVIFQSHGLQVQSLPMKRVMGVLSVDVDALEDSLENGTVPVPRMIYVVPTHQNPTGHTMPMEDRWKLCQLARKYNILVVADEVYHLLDWRESQEQCASSSKRPARFSVLDRLVVDAMAPADKQSQRLGGSVSVNSFTKIFAPGVRCGWVEGSPEIIQSMVDLGYIQSQGGCAPFIGEVLRTALTGGWQERILNDLVQSYRDRCNMLCDILQAEPGIQIYNRPIGGFFVWVDFVDLPNNEDEFKDPASAFAQFCLDRGLKIMPGTRCDSTLQDYASSQQSGELCYNSARLCFADMDVQDVEKGAKLLIECYREYTGKSTAASPTSSTNDAREIIALAAAQIVEGGDKIVVLMPIKDENGSVVSFAAPQRSFPSGSLVVPGSFNPPHQGHVALASASLETHKRRIKGSAQPTIFFELSIMNADKPAIDPETVADRVVQFLHLPNMPQSWGVILNSAPLFAEKLEHFKTCINSDDPTVNFVIGTDTLVRILNPKYYGDNESNMIEALKAMTGAHFIVGGRLEQNMETSNPMFVSGENELKGLPDSLADEMFTIMTESEFRVDLSSTEIRKTK
jgi:DNA-binding transcriptional MocR family regulator